MNRTLFIAPVAAVLLALLATAGSAQAAGELAKVDEAVNRWKTLDYHYKIVTKDGGGKKSVLRLRMRMRTAGGHNQQLSEISEPKDMSGTVVLHLSPTKMYIYLPAFKKVRRIASHVNDAGFLGTAMSARDMTLTRYSKYYEARVLSESVKKVKLKLTEKAGTDAPYASIVMVVDKSRWVPVKFLYYNDSGKHLRTEKRAQYSCEGGYCFPRAMKVTDHAKNVVSKLFLKKHRVNPKLSGKLFSKRILTK